MHQVQISGTLGTLQCDLLAGTARLFRVESKKWDEYAPQKNWERNDMFMEEMRHFLAVVRGEVAPVCTLDDGIQVMRLIAAAQKAHKAGHRVNLKR